MDRKSKKDVKGSASSAVTTEGPRSVDFARNGITTGKQFAGFMSALMSDLIEGKITPGVGNAACNAGGKLLKVVELQAKYGQSWGNRRTEREGLEVNVERGREPLNSICAPKEKG